MIDDEADDTETMMCTLSGRVHGSQPSSEPCDDGGHLSSSRSSRIMTRSFVVVSTCFKRSYAVKINIDAHTNAHTKKTNATDDVRRQRYGKTPTP